MNKVIAITKYISQNYTQSEIIEFANKVLAKAPKYPNFEQRKSVYESKVDELLAELAITGTEFNRVIQMKKYGISYILYSGHQIEGIGFFDC
jgi:hypothetical protein